MRGKRIENSSLKLLFLDLELRTLTAEDGKNCEKAHEQSYLMETIGKTLDRQVESAKCSSF